MVEKLKNIRVGIIRCDTHGMYYGALMDKFNPALLKQPGSENGKEKYSWEIGTVHFLFFRDCYAPEKMSVPKASGFTIAKVWDEHFGVAKLFSKVFYGKPEVCKSFEEVSDGVDLVFIADCNGNGDDHLELASPGLRKGVPTFIDKPFAYEASDAVKIVKLAEESKTPIASLSMLREAPQGIQFRSRLKEIGTISFGSVIGHGGSFANEIHSLSLAQNVFGSGVASVECVGGSEASHMLLYYEDKRTRPLYSVAVQCLPLHRCQGSLWSWKLSLYAVAYSPLGCIQSQPISDYEFPYGALRILNKVKRMVITRKPQVPYEDMIELIAIATAARKAKKEGKRVNLREVLQDSMRKM